MCKGSGRENRGFTHFFSDFERDVRGLQFRMFSHLVLVTVFKVFSFGRVVRNTLLIVFPLHKTLVTTLAKNLVKNLSQNLSGVFGHFKGL